MIETTFIGLQSPKTAWATMISTNLAILHQMRLQSKSVAYVQLSSYPDAHLHCSWSWNRSIFDILLFLDTKECDKELLNKIKFNSGCDMFISPDLSKWRSINKENFVKIVEFIARHYDTIYFDISPSIDIELRSYIYENLDMMIYVSSIDPVSLNALSVEVESWLCKKYQLIINQCPKSEHKRIKEAMEDKWIEIIWLLDQDSKSVWHNVYEWIPVALQKKSKLKKQLIEVVDNIILNYS